MPQHCELFANFTSLFVTSTFLQCLTSELAPRIGLNSLEERRDSESFGPLEYGSAYLMSYFLEYSSRQASRASLVSEDALHAYVREVQGCMDHLLGCASQDAAAVATEEVARAVALASHEALKALHEADAMFPVSGGSFPAWKQHLGKTRDD